MSDEDELHAWWRANRKDAPPRAYTDYGLSPPEAVAAEWASHLALWRHLAAPRVDSHD